MTVEFSPTSLKSATVSFLVGKEQLDTVKYTLRRISVSARVDTVILGTYTSSENVRTIILNMNAVHYKEHIFTLQVTLKNNNQEVSSTIKGLMRSRKFF